MRSQARVRCARKHASSTCAWHGPAGMRRPSTPPAATLPRFPVLTYTCSGVPRAPSLLLRLSSVSWHLLSGVQRSCWAFPQQSKTKCFPWKTVRSSTRGTRRLCVSVTALHSVISAVVLHLPGTPPPRGRSLALRAALLYMGFKTVIVLYGLQRK